MYDSRLTLCPVEYVHISLHSEYVPKKEIRIKTGLTRLERIPVLPEGPLKYNQQTNMVIIEKWAK